MRVVKDDSFISDGAGNFIYLDGFCLDTCYQEIYGDSTEEKPVEGVSSGSKFMCEDTGEVYCFDEDTMEWYLDY